MSDGNIDPVIEDELRDQFEDVRRLQSELLESAKKIAPLVLEAASLQQYHNDRINALEAALARLYQKLDELPDSQLRAILSPDMLTIGVEPEEKDLIGWTYRQLRAGSKSEADLRDAYERRFDIKADDFMAFLSNCRYFRRANQGDEAHWMISANREDDLRDFLAE